MTPDGPNPYGIEEREYVPFCPVPSCETEFMFAGPDEVRDHLAREHGIPRHAVVFPSKREVERLQEEPDVAVDDILGTLRSLLRRERKRREDEEDR